MNRDEYLKASELEKEGKIEAAGKLLRELAAANDPHALIELGTRYLLNPTEVPEHYCPGINAELSHQLIEQGRVGFERRASAGDSEAMRMLGYFYLGYLCPAERDIPLAEQWLGKAFESGCYFAANDLATLYLGSNRAEAKRWYQLATQHNCRVIYHPELET